MVTGFAVVGAISASWGFMKDILSYLRGIKGAKEEITDILLRFENDLELLHALHQFFTEERLQTLDEDSLGHLTRVFSYLLPITQDSYAKVLDYQSISLGDKIQWATWGSDLKSSEKRVYHWIKRLQTCFIWFPEQMKQQLFVTNGAPSALSQMRAVVVQQEMEKKVTRLREAETRQIKSTNGDFKLPEEQVRSIAITSRRQIVEIKSVQRLVEYRRIPASMAGDVSYQEETEIEAMKLVSLLSSVEPAEMFVLRTAFYFETSDRSGRPVPSIPFGIAYDLPDGYATPTQLSALWDTKEGEKPRHPLNERFELARQISTAVLFMHSVDWFHKGIQASNVWLAHHAKSTKRFPQNLGTAFLAGFDYTRRDAAQSTGDEAGESWRRAIYQHPERTRVEDQSGQSTVPFRAEHDIYSLGVVLVEIGWWRSLGSWESLFKSAGPEDRKKHLENLAQKLTVNLGEKYTAIALRCIRVLDDRTVLPPRGSLVRHIVSDLDSLSISVGS